MRNALLACTRFDWSRISPAIFGSLFQAIMEPRERRQIGGHYTTERDILKVIRSLFLDDLRAEFERIKGNKAELRRFHKHLAGLRFLDPACGCGNFLVITYRELRLLELEILKILHGGQREAGRERALPGGRGPVLRHRDRRMARPHRRGGPLAHGPPDEHPALGGFGQYFARLPAEEIPDHRLRQRPAPGLEGNPSASTSAATCWAIRRLWENNTV